MARSKTLNLNNIFLPESIFVFLFLVLFPFGQIIRIGVVHPVDVVVGMAAVYSIIRGLEKPRVFGYLKNFLYAAGFAWLVSVFIFRQANVLYGLMYLIRLTAYVYFLIYVWNFIKDKANHRLLILSLLSVSVMSAVLGWVQFLVFPDIKPLFIWGWDMHLYRLVGTFFDPSYLGLIVVFGLLIGIHLYTETKNKTFIVIAAFLLVSLAFTYSRASYLAFIAGLMAMSIQKKTFKQILIPIFILVPLVLLLPTTRNHSIELFRSFSAIARIENYKTTIEIFEKSPVFGVGYDNLCIAYQKYIGFQKFSSHACSGSDSSLLFVLATTGIVGLFILLNNLSKVFQILSRNSYFVILTASFTALIIHSLFSNSMFYSWIMGWMVILLVLAV